jgi:hypothetical protein
MNTDPVESQRHVSRENPRPRPTEGVPAKIGVQSAVNDHDVYAASDDVANPLWVVTIGMAVFFGLALVLVALN